MSKMYRKRGGRGVGREELDQVRSAIKRLNIARGYEVTRLANLKNDYNGWRSFESLKMLQHNREIGYSKIGNQAWYFVLPETA